MSLWVKELAFSLLYRNMKDGICTVKIMKKKFAPKKMQRTAQPRFLLEQRIVFDAAIAATGADIVYKNSDAAYVPPAVNEEAGDYKVAPATEVTALSYTGMEPIAPVARTEIVFIDSAIQKSLTIATSPNTEVIVLQEGRDGVDQIAEVLSGRSNLSAIHIFSHGDAGKLNLGTATLDAANIDERYAADLAVIRAALTADGDVLIYGCDVANGAVGQGFLTALARATDADVAASVDATGAVGSGGNWTLEANTGTIETTILVPEGFVGLLAPPTITSTSTNVFYVDFGIAGTSQDITSAYASYLITNPVGSTAIGDLWVEIGNFTDASATEATSVILGAKESNLVELGTLAAGSSTTAFFYLQAQFETLTAQTHTIKLYDGDPTKGGILLNGAGSNFTFNQVLGVIAAGANKVTTTVAGPTPNALGGLVTVTISGDTGTVGAARIFSGSPATYTNWDANAYELVSTKYTFFYGAGTADDVIYTNQLVATLPAAGASLYEASFVFKAVGTTATPTALSPILEISSGTQIKHTSIDGNAALPPLNSTQNFLTLTKSTSTPLILGGGTANYTLTFTNTSGQVLSIDDITDFLPSALSYIAGSSVYNGLATVDPSISGSTLTWGNAINFSVAANSAVTLTFRATASMASGVYVNQAVARIGTVQIDTTMATNDDAKASATVTVNDNPTANNDGPIALIEDTVVSGNVLTNDSDKNGDAISVVQFLVAGVTGTFTAGQTATITGVGALTINSNGSFTFVPVLNYVGAVPTATYTLKDPLGATSTATLSFSNVAPVNDAPVNTLPATFSTNEDTSFKLVGLSISDVDAAASNVTVTLSVPTGTITAANNGSVTVTGSGTGTLVLTGTVGAINSYLTTVASQPIYAPAANANGSVTLTMVTNDGGNTGSGGALSDTDTSTINITAINDAPSGTDATIVVLEDNTRTFTSADFGFADAADTPANTLQSIVIATLPSNGTLRLSGTPITAGQELTVAQLAQLTFTPVANANGAAYTTFTFQVRDNGGIANGGVDLDQSANTITVNVTSVNDAPAGTDTTLTAFQDVARIFTAADFGLTDAADTPANALSSVVITTLPTNGTIRLSGVAITAGQEFTLAQLAQLTFTAATNASGVAYTSFTFQVRDNGGTASGGVDLDASPNTITFNVTSVNDAPAGTDTTLTAVEDTARTFTPADFGFTDTADSPANAFASVIITTLPTNGTIRLSGVAINAGQEFTLAQLAQLTFTAAANASGVAYTSFTFQVRDNGGTANGGVDIDQSANIITFNVTSVNDAPSGTNATLTAVEDTARTFTTADFGFTDANDTPANAMQSVVITSLPTNGTIRLSGLAIMAGQEFTVAQLAQLTFTGALNANGAAYTTFTFQVRDNGGTVNGGVDFDQSANTITINVTSVNDAPAGTDTTLTAVEDIARTFTAADFGFTDATDSPANALASVIITALPTNGTIRLNGVAITAGQEFTLAQLAQLTFTAAANANGTAYTSFTFQVRDNGGTANGGVDLDATPNTITFNVTSVNDAPAGTDTTLTVVEDIARTFTAADFGFTDTADSTANALASVIITTLPTNGTIRLSGVAITAGQEFTLAQLAQLTFTAAANASGAAYTSFTFQVRDNGGTANGGVDIDQSANIITFNVTSVNDAPSGTNATLTAVEDTARTFTAGDFGFTDANDSPANAFAAVIITTLPTNGTILLSGVAIMAGQEFTVAQLAQLTFTAAPNANGNAYATFTFQVRDNGGTTNGGIDLDATPNTVTFNVTAVNDAPVANPDVANTSINTPAPNVVVLANDTDVDGNTLTVVSATVPSAQGTVVVNGDGTLTFTPANNFTGVALIAYNISDGNGGTATSTLMVNVSNNTPPDSADKTLTATEDTVLTIVTADFAFIDPDAGQTFVAVRIDTLPTSGVLRLNGVAVTVGQVVTAADIALNRLTYMPALNGNGANYANFTFSVQDSAGSFDTAPNRITLNVTAVNDDPIAVNDSVTTLEDTALTIPRAALVANDTDVDGDTLIITSVQGSVNGTVVLSGANVVFTPNANYNGPASFTYTVSDGNGGTSTATVNITVTAVNDNPVAVNDSAMTPINTTLASINVLGNDSDVDGDTVSVTSATVPAAQGSVTINSDGTLRFIPTTNFSGSATITYSIADGNGGTATASVTVNVGSNTPPDSTNATVTTLEDTTLTLTNANFVFTDADVGQTFAAVRIDTLPLNGTLLLNGTLVTAGQVIVISDINAGNLRFVPAANANGLNYASFNFSVQDSGGAFDATPNTVTVNVTPVNDAPVAVNDNAVTNEDTALVIATATLLANDTDIDGNTLTITSVQGAVNGTVILSGTNVTFTPAANYNGPASFTYTVSDGNGDTSTATVNLTVNAVNDPPVAVDDSATTNEDIALVIAAGTLLANDTDIDGNTLTIISVQGATNGTVSLSGTNVTFTPNANYNGPASFTYTVSDGNGGTSTATVSLIVNAVNDPPVAVNDIATTNEDTALIISSATLLANDTDVDGNTLIITSVQGATNGTVSLSGTTVTFTPNANYNGPASFTYTVSDGNGGTSTATVNLTVNAVNDPPVAVNDIATTNEDTPLVIAATTLLANDTDIDGNTLTISSVQGATNGTVSLVGSNVTFIPTTNYNGPASFTYTVSDGNGGTSTATVNLTVNAVNDPPVAVNDSATTNEDTPLVISTTTLLANDTDLDGDTLTIASVQGATNGTVSLSGTTITFTPNANYNGPASFTYTVSDGNGGTSTATVDLTVNAVNDPPVAVNDNATTNEDTALVIAATTLLANDTDIDGNTLTITSVQDATNGTVILSGTNVTFTPTANYNGPASFTYTVSDGNGGTSTATVNLTVNAVNDPPVAVNDNAVTNEDTALVIATATLLANDTDIDGNTLTIVSVQSATNGTVSLSGTNVTFTPTANYNGPASFTYTVSDGNGGTSTATVNLTVNPVNDPPVAVNDNVVTNEDTALLIAAATLLTNDSDVDGNALTVTSVQAATNGTVSLSGTTVTFTPNANYNGPASFTYTITDGNGGTSTATVNITVTPVNDNPVAVSDSATTPINTTVASINVLGNDTDVDGDTLSVASATVPAVQGSVTINNDGTLRFIPALNFTGPATITYSISDGNSGTASSTVVVNVGANTPPDSANATVTTLEDTSITLTNANFAFIDADVGQTFAAVRIDTLPVNGNLRLNGVAVTAGQVVGIADINAGNLRFAPSLNSNGVNYANFNFSVQDSGGAFDTTPNTITVNVTPVNDTPIAVNDTVTTPEDTVLTIARATLVANDTDVDGDTLTITSVQGAVNGTVSLVGVNVIFIPNANYNGPASFTYTVSDGNGGVSTATVNITVTAVNDNPVANTDNASTAINTTITSINVLGNDTDVDGNTLSVTSATVLSAQGAVTINIDGTLQFVPALNFSGTATIAYSISDGSGGTATSTVNVFVGANTPPDSANVTVTTSEDTTLTLTNANFAFTDADAGQTLIAIRVDTLPISGTLRLNGIAVSAGQVVTIADINAGNLRFIPALNGNGANYTNFTFSVQDSGGAFDATPNTATINVTPVNDAPIAINDAATTPEDTPLTIAHATLLANDTDVDGDTLIITSVQSAVNGTVALVGANVVFTPNANYNGPASFTYTVSDSNGGISTATVNFTVTPVNDNPVANTDSASTAINTTITSINVLGNDTDVDGDILSVTSATVPAAQGTVSINSDGTLRFVPALNFSGPATITYSVSDGNGGTSTNTVAVNVGANTPPNSANATVTTAEDTTLTLVNSNFAFTDADATQTLAAVRIDTLPVNGTLLLNGVAITVGQLISITNIDAGNLRFVPALNANGVNYASFNFSVQDSSGAFDTTPNSITVNVTPVNDTPVATNDAVTTTEDTPLTIAPATLLGNDTDVDGDTLTIQSVQAPVNGSVSIVGGNVVFKPNANYNGPASFTYTVTDGKGGSSTATVNIAVTAVNDTPVANADTAGTAINVTVASINVLGNDTDVDADTLSVTSATVPAAQGSVTINSDGTLRFAPALDFTGPATITYAISDGNGGTATSIVTVNVSANTPPDSANATVTTLEDTILTLTNANFAFTDVDASQSLAAVRIDTLPINGSLRLSGVAVTAGQVITLANINAGNLRFVPVANANGVGYAAFNFSVQDSGGAFDATPNAVTIDVTPVNDAPVAVNDVVTVAEDTPLTISRATLVANDTDVDADTLAITSVQGAVNGTVALSGANVVFTPTANYNGPASFTYTISDGNGGTSTATVNITVTPVNDAPVANIDNASTPINTTLASINALGNDTDVDGNTLTITSATVLAAQGSVSINSDGTLRFVPASNFSGVATINYSISDGNGGTAASTVSVFVGANTPPDSANATVTTAEDTPLSLTLGNFAFTDADGGQTLAAVRIDTLPINGTLRLNGVAVTAGQIVPAADIAAGNLTFSSATNANGVNYASFNFSVQDSGGAFDAAPNTITVNVSPVNDAPVAVNDLASTAEDTPLTIASMTLLSNDTDVDGDTLTITSVQGAINGSVALSGANVVFTPNANYNGPASFTYTVFDGNGGTSTATVNITVTSVNDTPVAVNDSATTAEDTQLTLTPAALLGNDTDIDGDTLSIQSVQGAVNGSVALVSGNAVFTPNANYNGPASFTYTVTDGNGGVATATVNVTVTSVNDNPVANSDTATTQVNAPVIINVLGNDTDVDGNTLSITSATVPPARGTVVVNGDGTLTFTPATNVTGTSVITYFISDGNGGTATSTVAITVGANTPPDSANVTLTTLEDTTFTLTNANFAFTDADGGQTFAAVRIDSLPTSGSLRLNGVAVTAGQVVIIADVNAGNFQYVPALNGNGVNYASFTFSVQDSSGAFDTIPNTATINVTPVNDTPVANSDTATTAEDTPLTFAPAALLGNDTDIDGDTLTIQSVQGAVNGSIALVGGNVVFTPTANYNGPASFTYTVSDGNGATSTATVNLTVVSVNDNPVANTDSASTPVNVPLSNINVLGNDTDIDGDPIRLTGATVPAGQGTVTRNADGTINFTPANNFSGTANVTYTISDSNGGTASGTLSINVGANTPPNGGSTSSTFNEDTALTFAPGSFVFTDADGGQTLQAVRIDSLPTKGSLTFNGMPVVAGQVILITDIAFGKLVYTPVANENGAPYAGFTYSVQDSGGAFDTTPDAYGLVVVPINDAPIANNDLATTPEDTALTLAPAALLGNDTDVDGNTLTIASVQGAVNGTVVLSGGNVVFTPNTNYDGPASFTYTVSDGNGETSTATVNITVTQVNDNPVANADAASTAINLPLSNINVLGNDTDIDGDKLGVTSATVNSAQGSVTVNSDGTLNFTPALNFTGPARITYIINDGNGGIVTGTLTVNVGANTPPDSANANVTTPEDTALVFNTGNFVFTDADAGQTLANVRIETIPVSGSLRLNDVAVSAGQIVSAASIAAGNLTYSPALNGNGLAYANFTFSVQDSAGAFDTMPNPMSIDVTPVNDAPLAVNDNATTLEDTPLTIPSAALLNNDTDVDGNTLTIVSVQGATNGSVAIVGGNVVFTPDANYNGPASFTYTVSDGNGGTSTATVVLDVKPVNDAPVANPDIGSTTFGKTLSNIDVLRNDTDIDGDILRVLSATVNPAEGVVTINSDGTLSFTPALNFTGPATVTYTVSDGNGASTSGTLTINVGANAQPTSADATLLATEDTALVFNTGNFVFTDADMGQTLLNVRIDTIPTIGVLQLNGIPVSAGQLISAVDIAGGRFTFLPALNGNGANYTSFTFSVQDSDGAFSANSNAIAVDVAAVNDTPMANPDTATTPEDTVLTLSPGVFLGNDTDVDGDTLTIVSVQGAVGGTVAIVGGNVVFTPIPNFNGPASFAYTMSDGKGGTATSIMSVNVTPVDDVLVADVQHDAINDTGSDTTDSVTRNNSPAIVGASTPGDTITLYAQDGVTVLGTAVVDPAGNWSIDPNAAYLSEGLNNLIVRATDPNGNQSAATPVQVVLDTTPTPAPSVIIVEDANSDGTISQAELSGPINVKIVLPVGAKEGDTLQATDGQVVITFALTASDIANGNVMSTFSNPGEGQPITISATITDVAGNTGVPGFGRATLYTTPLVANPDRATALPTVPLVIDVAELLVNDTGAPGRPLTVVSVQDAVNGTVALVNGSVVFTPNSGFSGDASFTYTVSDGNNQTSTSSVSVAVLETPAPPTEAPTIYNPRVEIAPASPVIDYALYVENSVRASSAETSVRSGMGVFVTDGATFAELSSETASRLDSLKPAIFDGLFVQHAVRNESLVSDPTLFVQTSVRASQLEASARSVRINSVNSATPGVSTVLDPFANGAPSLVGTCRLAQEDDCTSPVKKEQWQKDAADKAGILPEPLLSKQTVIAPVQIEDSKSIVQNKRRAADGFASQLRQNALRPDTRSNGVSGARGR